jgi:hypothetical protein
MKAVLGLQGMIVDPIAGFSSLETTKNSKLKS